MAFCSDVFGAGLTDWAEKHGQVGTDEILMAGGLAPGPSRAGPMVGCHSRLVAGGCHSLVKFRFPGAYLVNALGRRGIWAPSLTSSIYAPCSSRSVTTQQSLLHHLAISPWGRNPPSQSRPARRVSTQVFIIPIFSIPVLLSFILPSRDTTTAANLLSTRCQRDLQRRNARSNHSHRSLPTSSSLERRT